MIESAIKAGIFDYGRTLYDPDKEQLIDGALDVLSELNQSDIRLALVSRGQNPKQRKEEIVNLGLKRFFQVIEVVGSEGVKKFDPILDQLGVTPPQTIVIGDRIESEIAEGNRVGATTIWYRNGKFADELPSSPEEEPTFTVSSLSDIIPIIRKIK